MPLLILAALVVIVLMLYIALGGKEGAPTINLNKILDFIMQKPPAADTAADAAGTKAPDAETKAAGAEAPEEAKETPAATGSSSAEETSGTGERTTPAEEAPAETDPAAAKAASAETGEGAEAETVKGGAGDAPGDAAFSSMEELTEFYRKEAERLTGIKH
ncbi:MAG: hypothetical protein LBP30_07580 [Clostridiales Family XIII bacterium]|jgi:hypothetical protein|nr:hypothetical protein [Clostridiales Family XIII bacterium]